MSKTPVSRCSSPSKTPKSQSGSRTPSLASRRICTALNSSRDTHQTAFDEVMGNLPHSPNSIHNSGFQKLRLVSNFTKGHQKSSPQGWQSVLDSAKR